MTSVSSFSSIDVTRCEYICNCWFPLFQEIIYETELSIFTSHYILPKRRFFDALARMLDDWLTFTLFNILIKNTSFIWRGQHCLLRAAIFRPLLGFIGLWDGCDTGPRYVISSGEHALTINKYHVESSADIVMVFTHVSETLRATWCNSNEGNDSTK